MPDAALLDIGLPGMDGYEVARRIQAGLGVGKVLLVAVTGHARDQDRQRCEEAGFHHHLAKPYQAEQVQALLAGIERPQRED